MKSAQCYFTALLLLVSATCVHAQHTVTKLWETDSVLAIPESALPDKEILYVSLINGDGGKVDGIGGVGKLTRDGKIIDSNWITGLNAPKGMAIVGNLMYVADLSEVVVIDIAKGAIDHKIKPAGAAGLNDVSADDKGMVYVSDSKKGTVYRIDHDAATLYVEGIKGVNGVKAVGDKLYVLGSEAMYVADADKKMTRFCTLENGGDGIEPLGNGDFLVTAWVGYLYYVHADGTKDIMLDTHVTQRKTADIGYDPSLKIIYVPTFFGKSVAAYKLE